MAKAITLRNVPKDIMDFIIKIQAEKKIENNKGQFGYEPTLYAIVRDYKRCSEAEKTVK